MNRSPSIESGLSDGQAYLRYGVTSARRALYSVRTRNSEKSVDKVPDPETFLKHKLFVESDFAEIALTQLSHPNQDGQKQDVVDPRWYQWWLSQQLSLAPQHIFSALPTKDTKEVIGQFTLVWKSIAEYLSENGTATIDSLVEHLDNKELLGYHQEKAAQQTASQLAFAILGWQTMLFRADCGSNPANYLAIAEETSTHDARTHLKLRSSPLASKDPIYKCLLGFGVLLPPKNYNLSTIAEHKKAFNDIREISSSNLNASLITQIGRIEIKWTSCLSCHLEFDATADCLYLFRYPSFCIANRRSGTANHQMKRILHACAQPSSSCAVWAKEDDVSDMLEEVLMSYRLLFGQNKQSRRLFRNLEPFEGIPNHAQDKALVELCGRKHSRVDLVRADRKHWDLKHDFPIFRSRLSLLSYEMSLRKPRSWSELWNDKRDSAQWATFWMVLVIGGIGLFLSLLQVILQLIQLLQNR